MQIIFTLSDDGSMFLVSTGDTQSQVATADVLPVLPAAVKKDLRRHLKQIVSSFRSMNAEDQGNLDALKETIRLRNKSADELDVIADTLPVP